MTEGTAARVYFDSMVLIVAFEGDDEVSLAIKGLFALFQRQPGHVPLDLASLSDLTAALVA
jgi:hypothetical protein